MTENRRLLFVYNADSGLFNTMADIGHKVFSPETYECALCSLTHGYFSEQKAWREFIEGLGTACDFMHRDEFFKQYPGNNTGLPVVFAIADGQATVCADADAIKGCESLDDLKTLIREHCSCR